VEEINHSLVTVYDEQPLSLDDMVAELTPALETIRPFIGTTVHELHDAVDDGESILLEGAQGSLLDIDHGTYPYVTSSSPTSGGACTGSGLSPRSITHVMGITKAYCTRVGNGPFPTELNDEYGELLRKEGREFGATTGRPRRCGWLDLVALRYAVRLNGMNEIALTKLDILDHVDQIKVCVGYELDGQRVEEFPTKLSELERVVPIYETLQGWKGESTRNIDTFEELPAAAQAYVEWVEQKLGVPFTIVSTGPGREETLQRTT
jgi:adenylosuccinate synthase